MVETLKFTIEDSKIAELLGVQNFTNKESAILELVKNSYDAGATELSISFVNNSIQVIDNGRGMSRQDIIEHWMHVGYSNKKYEFEDKNKKKRIYAGAKGIGRFALSRLGREVRVITKTEKDKCKTWYTDWHESTLAVSNDLIEHGTHIIINDLRDKWTSKSISELSLYLSKTYNDDSMEIKIIEANNKVKLVAKYFDSPKFGQNCVTYFKLKYNSNDMKLTVEIHSDEFEEKAKSYCFSKNINYSKSEIDLLAEFQDEKKFDLEEKELLEKMTLLGDFDALFYFSLKGSSPEDAVKFFYKYNNLLQRFNEGIILYRNAFSISSYEGKKDWLGLGKRSRLSPAAATHPTGSWRVRENQIAGYVNIDKEINKNLQDLSNRQGLSEDIFFDLFVEIILTGIKEFERYRQTIIRSFDVKNKTQAKQQPLLDEIIKNPELILNYSKNDAHKLAKALDDSKKEKAKINFEVKNTEDRYKYDVRILNVLSTLGLKAASIAHEMRNDKNMISKNYELIVQAMQKFGVWDFVNSAENTQYAYENIPEMLLKNKKINTKIIAFMDTLLSDVEKEQFIIKLIDIEKTLDKIKSIWERDYSWISIIVEAQDIRFLTSEDIIKVIMDNLILNSVQQNETKDKLKISINANYLNEGLYMKYSDNGIGLAEKYKSNPRKILEVHESSRNDGHGLGMWIINNTINMSGGKVLNINGDNGFEISMIIGDKL